MQVLYEEDAVTQPGAIVLGNLDGLHCGHRVLLKEAYDLAKKAKPSWRTRVITFSPHTSAAHLQEPMELIYSDEQKLTLLKESGLVDEVVVLAFTDAVRTLEPEVFFEEYLIKRYHAQAVIIGDNFRFGKNGRGDSQLMETLCRRVGIICRSLKRSEINGEPISSSRIRTLLAEGRIQEANLLLGRPYFIEGPVKHGKQIGRTIKTPTLNLPLMPGTLTPKKGVYVTRCYTDSGVYESISNVGQNPTVEKAGSGLPKPHLETHLFDFSGDLYDQTVRVELLAFLRPEQRFESVDALHEQLMKDIAATRQFFQSVSE